MKYDSTSGSPGKDEPVTWTKMGEFVSEITWTWPGWLPNGFVVIVAGSSGTGKSMLVLRLCGCFTNGWDWPDGTPFTGNLGSVLWCEGEAAQAINLERARQYNLDMDRIITPFKDPLQDIDLDDKSHRKRIEEIAHLPEVKVIVIDSLRGVNGQDENSSNINEMIKFLAEIARDTGKIIILTHHLRKKGIVDGDEVELDRLRGSSAIVQNARVILAIDSPNGQDKAKRLRVIKSNLGKFPPALGFTITENGIIFCEAPSQPVKFSLLEEAKDLLKLLLGEGSLPVSEIKKHAEESGISWRTFATAKKLLRIVSRKIGGKGGHIEWGLPAPDIPPQDDEPD